MNSKLQPPGHNHGTISSSGNNNSIDNNSCRNSNGSNVYAITSANSHAITINIALIESIADEVAKTINNEINKSHAMINSSTSNNTNSNSTVISFKPFEGSFQNS